MRRRAVVGLGTAALAVIGAARIRKALGRPMVETGTFANGMEYARWGDGPRRLIWIPGGPGSDVPRGAMGTIFGSTVKPLVDAGYSVWLITRKRNMPVGHSIEDMAADYAALIAEQFGGRVDVVVGVSYGGAVLLYLAANHPTCAEHFVAALAAGTITEWGRDVDYRWAQARARGDGAEAGRVMAEYVFPDPSQSAVRSVMGQVMRGVFSGETTPPGDLMVEAEAEMAFDARDALPRISVPVLLISAEEDMFFTPQIVDETVALIPESTVVRYPGKGHLRAASSGRLFRDVLEYANR